MDDFEAGQRDVLERIARGAALDVVLDALVRLIEREDPGSLCSVLLVDPVERVVRHGAAPSLPAAYVAAIDGSAIGPAAGSCGTAAWRRTPVIVEDIATDPLWAEYRAVALPYGLRACWSTPILSPEGSVLGTFAMYYREPRRPGPGAARWIDAATWLASIALVRERDRLEARRLEDAIRRSEAQKAFVLEQIADVVFCVVVEGDEFWFAAVNPAFLRSTGLAEADVVGHRVVDVIPPSSRALVLANYRRAIAERRTVVWDETSIYPSGVRHGEVAVSPAFDGDGRCTRLVGTVRDITERKRQEERIAAQAALLDSARDAIVVRTLDHVVEYWNAGAERLYGIPRDRAIGRRITELLYQPGDLPAFEAATARAVHEGGWTGDLRQRTAGGRALDVECRWTLLADDRGLPAKILAINTDVTARRELEARVVHVQRLESLGLLASGIAHDFNNVLATIAASIELAKTTVEPSDPAWPTLRTIDRAADRASALVRQIMAFSGRKRAERRPMDAWPVIDEALLLLRATLPAAITVRATHGEGAFPVDLDPSHVHQLLLNLATNAWHAMEGGGTLTITLDGVESAEPIPSAPPLPPGRYTRLTVADTGTGIDADTLAQMFRPYFTTKPAGKGTGLGLFVVHDIVRRHHGGIVVTSAPGRGATFEVYLPAALGPLEPVEVPVSPPIRGDGQRVMIVDDEVSLLALVTEQLRGLGFAAEGFGNPASALRALQADPSGWDAFVTDYAMAGISGLDLAREVRHVAPSLPIVLIAGYPTEGIVADARRLGVRAVLGKPDFVTALPATLGALFGHATG
jgi:PAS domain S-box-containing protein